MILLEMKTENGQLDYMVKFENEQDEAFYNECLATDSWAKLDAIMEDELGVKDVNIAYYLTASEQEPAVGETFELDDIKYERVA